jgi:hypothetical protein
MADQFANEALSEPEIASEGREWGLLRQATQNVIDKKR